MIKKTYALLDTTAQRFLNSLEFVSDGEAIRWFQTQVDGDKENNLIAKYPSQFILYRLNDFDDQIGKYLNTIDHKEMTTPKEIIFGSQLQKTVEAQITLEQVVNMFEKHLENQGKVVVVKNVEGAN
jgi:hypothetical protein